MHIFYTPDISGSLYSLNEQESKHCIRVLRLTEGDQIQLVDGKGGFYQARIAETHPKRCTVEITNHILEYGKRPWKLHMAVAPTKNIDRFEWFLEKATEIGIDSITPILCRYSERKVIKIDRLQKVITSAMKQSLKAYHPVLNPLTPFEDLIKKPFDGQKMIAHCYDGEKTPLKNGYTTDKDIQILIGPEGDFSEQEVAMALENHYTPISLGSSRLRTETAAVVACHTINLLNE